MVFYTLASESAPLEWATKRYEAEHLVGYKADFWADIEPYLTVLAIDDFMGQADKVEDGLSEAARTELGRIRNWARVSGQPIVGYQLEKGDST